MSQLSSLLSRLYPDSPPVLPITHLKPKKSPDWHTQGVMYVTYPNAYGSGFGSLSQQLPRLSSLGITSIHVLPFLSSPRQDGGFDVADYYTVDPRFGGQEAFFLFLTSASKLGMHVFMDLVLNHVSNQHPWFVKASSGDPEARDIFVFSSTKPVFIRKEVDADGVWAWYQGSQGEYRLRIIFPEQVGEIPHWTQADDGNWYYHTFYPSQLDLNWKNPRVFEEMIKVVSHWGERGLSFRLDAVPFIGKEIESGIAESGPRTFPILEALTQAARIVAPDSVFLVEANQPVDTLVAYLGKEAPLCQMAYQFPLMSALWECLVTGETDTLDKVLSHQRQYSPSWGQYVTFLRNHDELSLEFVSNQSRKILRDSLEPNGLPFREGFGITGRVRDLAETVSMHILIHGLLLSMPGIPAIYYGDELGLRNNWGALRAAQLAKTSTNQDPLPADNRDLHRGPVQASDLTTPEARLISEALSHLNNTRSRHHAFFETHPELIGHEPGVVELKYYKDNQCLRVFFNLCTRTVAIEATQPQVLFQLGLVAITDSAISLAPESMVWWLEERKSDHVT